MKDPEKFSHWLYRYVDHILAKNTSRTYTNTIFISKHQVKLIKVWTKIYSICLHHFRFSLSRFRYHLVFLKWVIFWCSYFLPARVVIYPHWEFFFQWLFSCKFDTSWRITRADLQESAGFFLKGNCWERFAPFWIVKKLGWLEKCSRKPRKGGW
jgi:hypothetical protein